MVFVELKYSYNHTTKIFIIYEKELPFCLVLSSFSESDFFFSDSFSLLAGDFEFFVVFFASFLGVVVTEIPFSLQNLW